MISGQLIDSWALTWEGYLPVYKFKIAGIYPGNYTDASGQPVQVETPVILDFTVSDSVYDDILADNDYGIGAILYSEVVEDGA